MKHNYKLSLACLLAGAAMCTTATADKAVKTVTVNSYGDYMEGGDALQSSLVSFFDGNNKLVRKGLYGIGGDLLKYYTYKYNDKGLLSLSFSRQVTVLDNGMEGFYEAFDSTKYEYDEQGRLIAETGQQSFKYTYDANGNMTSKEEIGEDWEGNLVTVQKITYSDFIAPNCPQKLVSEGQYESYAYVGVLTYNSANQLVKESDYVNDGDSLVFSKSTTNYYDADGKLLAKVRHQQTDVYDYDTWEKVGSRIDPVDSIVYTRDGLNTKEETYIYNSYSDDEEKWNKQVTFTVTTESEIDGALASAIAVEAVEGEHNTNKITVTAADAAASGYFFNVYRDGTKIAKLSPDSAMSYTDKAVLNGEHDYFVQTVANGDSLGYTVSDVYCMENHTDLPTPINVRGTGKKNESVEGYSDGTSMYIAWDMPENTAEYGLKGFNVINHTKYYDGVMNEGMLSDDTNTLGIDMFGVYEEKTLFVQAVYDLGFANSDTVTIKMADLPLIEPTAINGVASAAGQLTLANDAICLDSAANISVMDMGGRKVGEAKNATSLSLAQLPKGVYVVSVERDGKLSMAKIRK